MRLILSLALITATAAPAFAQDQPSPAEAAQQLREGHMKLFAFNLGPLVAMAKGEAEYDADAVAMRAGNIAALASVDFGPYWVEGSSSEDLEDSRALPAIWNNLDDVAQQSLDLVEAAQALESAAPQGQDAFTAAFRDVGKACSSCHEDYREPDEDE